MDTDKKQVYKSNIGRSLIVASLLLSPIIAKEIVFIDKGIKNYNLISQGINKDIATIILDSKKDRIKQIANALANEKEIEAVHIFSHGESGSIILGDQHFAYQDIQSYKKELEIISLALKIDATMLLYGCDIGKDLKGQKFVNALSKAVHTDVIASTNKTGNPQNGGDWLLETNLAKANTHRLFDTVDGFSELLPSGNTPPTYLNSDGNQVWAEGESNSTKIDLTSITDSFAGIDVGNYSTPTFVDIDNDGDDDLFVGEEDGNINYYRNDGDANSANYTLVTETFAGIDVGYYSSPTFVDIDNDGDYDLFVGERSGNINYYRNDGNATSANYTLVTETFAGIDVGSYSVPTFVDSDNDGDYDLFVGEGDYLGTGNINYYRNDGDANSANYTLVTETFAGIDLGGFSSPTFVDSDNDRDYDLFVGEYDGNINYYRNDGDANSANYTLVTETFAGIDVGYYSSPTFVDSDNDGDDDLFVGEHTGNINYFENIFDPSIRLDVAENQTAVTILSGYDAESDPVTFGIDSSYKDSSLFAVDSSTGALSFISAPNFENPTDANTDNVYDINLTISDGTADNWTIAHVSVTDVNDAPTYLNSDGNQVWAEGESNSTKIDLTSITETFAGINVGGNSNPTFVDIDNDGDYDLFVGEGDGNINYYRNDGDANSANYTLVTETFAGIDVGYVSTPTFVDIDNDGDYDLFVGEYYGNINYYRNDGNATSANYTLVTETFAGIDVGKYSVPTFVDSDNDGDYDLFVGENAGNINYFENVGSATSASYTLVTETFAGIDVGNYSNPTFVDSDNDGDYDLFMGENAGNINYFENIFDPSIRLDVAENQTAVTTLSGYDAEANPVTFGIDSSYGDSSLFAVDSSTGALSFISAPNFENPIDANTDNVYDINLTITDGTADNWTIAHVRVTNINEAPVWSIDTNSTDEERALTLQLGDYLTDPENNNTIIYTATSTDTNKATVTLSGSTLTVTPLHNIYGVVDINVTAFDGDNNISNTIKINIANVNDAPTYLNSDGNQVWAEGESNVSKEVVVTSITDSFAGINVGDNSTPAFVDIDNDGDYDLFVGEVDGNINYYRNDGSATSASYTLVTETFAGIAVGYVSTPTFVDIDNDGDYDLFVRDGDGNINYYRNDGNATSANYTLVTETFAGINVGGFSTPTFVDSDNDGDYDLFVGSKYGTIEYYENVGSATSASYTLVTETFAGIAVGYVSTPTFVDIDNDGDYDLFVGEGDGNINYYRNDGNATSANYTLVTETFAGINVGGFSTPTFVDSDNDGDYDLFVGEYLGNINYYENTTPVYVDPTLRFDIAENQTAITTLSGYDAESDPVTFRIDSGYKDSSLFAVDSSTGALSFISAPNFENPTDANTDNVYDINLTISDGTADNWTIAHVSVTDVNDNPTITMDSTLTTNEDNVSSLTFTLADDEDSTLTLNIDTNATNGTVTISGTAVTYTPNANYNGADSFVVSTTDSNGAKVSQTINVTVSSVNDIPTITIDSTLTTDEDNVSSLTFSISDVEDSNLTLSVDTNATNGTVAINGSAVTYTPNANYNGADSFVVSTTDSNGAKVSQTINVTVSSVNDDPTITIDSTLTTNEDNVSSLTFSISDVEDSNLTLAVDTNATNGTVAINGSAVTYTPNANYNGADSFVVSTTDSNGAKVTQTINVTVSSVNDIPTITIDSTLTTDEDNGTTLSFSFSDVDGDSVTAIEKTAPTHGTISISGTTINYTPTANYNGTDSFVITMTDSAGYTTDKTINVTVSSVNDIPTITIDSTLTTDEDNGTTLSFSFSDVDGDSVVVTIKKAPQNGVVTIDGLNITYTPNIGFSGADSYILSFDDGAGGVVDKSIVVMVNPATTTPQTPVDENNVTDPIINQENNITVASITNVLSHVPDTNITTNAQGEVTVLAEITIVGEVGFVYRAIVTVDTNGRTKTKIIKVNLATKEETLVSNTLRDNQFYEAGNKVEISIVNGMLQIKITTKIKNPLIIE